MKKIITFMLVLLTSICISAQNPGNGGRAQNGRREFSPELYMKALNEFVAREAKLTEAESAKFCPLLNEMFAKQHQIMGQQRELMMKSWKNVNNNEDEYENIVTKLAALEVESKKVEQTYYKKFHTVLSWKKIFAVRIALQRFQVEALNRFQPGQGRGNNMNRSFNNQQPNRNFNNNQQRWNNGWNNNNNNNRK
jgi:hypothetical protein